MVEIQYAEKDMHLLWTCVIIQDSQIRVMKRFMQSSLLANLNCCYYANNNDNNDCSCAKHKHSTATLDGKSKVANTLSKLSPAFCSV